MPLDVTLAARQVGVSETYKDARVGGVSNLPQRVFMIAQGETGVSFSTTKFVAESANHVGQVAGYHSQAYLLALQLLPKNGDGLGTVPLTVALLGDAGSSQPSVGDITPSGTATSAQSYVLNVSEVKSRPFVVPSGAVNVSNVCRMIGQAANTTLGMPVKATYTYGAVTASALTGTGNGTITALSVTGTPLPGVYRLTVNTAVANGGVWTLVDPEGTTVSSTLTQTVGASQATVLSAGGIQFTITDGTSDFGLGAYFDITVPATKVTLTSAWKGTTTNDITLQIDGPSPGVGVNFAITQPVGGLVDPDPQSALDQVGESWETVVLNGLNLTNSTALDSYKTWGEGRWSADNKKGVLVFTGAKVTTPSSAIVVSDARKTDRINSQIPTVGSRNLPSVLAARAVARIASAANNDPSKDFCLKVLDGITPGSDGIQWNLSGRDAAIKGGSSTLEIVDSVARLSNVVTFYHPTGEDPPAYRHAIDSFKLMNITYNVRRIFETEEWAGAALVPDEQAVSRPSAKKPKMAKAELAALVKNLAAGALISDPDYSIKNMTAVISTQDPKRLDITLPLKLSGNANVINIEETWSFHFAAAA